MTSRPPEVGESTDDAPSRGLAGRTVAGAAWTVSASVVQGFLRAAALVVLARLLTPEAFGLVAAASSVIVFADIFSSLGVGPAIIQREELTDGHVRVGFTLSSLFGLGLLAGTWVAAPWIAAFFQMEELTGVLRGLAFMFPLQGFSVVANGLLSREMRFPYLAKAKVASYGLGYLGVAIVLALAGFGVWALVVGTLVQGLLRMVLMLAGAPHPKRPSLARAPLSDLVYYGGGITVSRVLNEVAQQGDFIVVGRWLGADPLGIYSKAYNMMTLPMTYTSRALAQVLFPAMSRVQGDVVRMGGAFRKSMVAVAVPILPASVLIWILAPELVRVLLGPGWDGVIDPLRILTIGMLLRANNKINGVVLQAAGLVRALVWRQALYAVLVLGGAYLGRRWGLSGVAWAVLGAFVVHSLVSTEISLRVLRLKWRDLLAAHGPLVAWGGLSGWVVGAAVVGLRRIGSPDVMVLAAGLVAGAVTLLASLWMAPRAVLGTDGLWAMEIILGRLPSRWRLRRALEERLGVGKAAPPGGRP